MRETDEAAAIDRPGLKKIIVGQFCCLPSSGFKVMTNASVGFPHSEIGWLLVACMDMADR